MTPHSTHMGHHIRRGVASDAERLAEITVAGWRYAYRGVVSDARLDALDPVVLAAARREAIAAPAPTAVFVAEDDGVVCGHCVVGPWGEDPSVGRLTTLYLDPTVIGRGIGAALHDAGVAHLHDAGFTDLMLWVFDANVDAIAFYEHRGWHVDGQPYHPPEWEAAGRRLRRSA